MRSIISTLLFLGCLALRAQPILVAGRPGRLEIRVSGEHSIRITLKPASLRDSLPFNPALAQSDYRATPIGTPAYAATRPGSANSSASTAIGVPAPVISLEQLDQPVTVTAGNLIVRAHGQPLTITVTDKLGRNIQQLVFNEDGTVSFHLADLPVMGMGEGGPKPPKEADWHTLPIQYDRRGVYDSMQPRWQSDAYGSRNPAAMLIQPGKWAIFVAAPWVEVDLRDNDHGSFIPWKPAAPAGTPQNQKDQDLDNGKGRPPVNKMVPGLLDIFVFDAHHPIELMKDFSIITGPAALPPRWALGYMQSHRTLENDAQMLGIADSFRAKKIPVDAVIYLGTGFTPRGWNKKQPSFEFNPEVFKRDPVSVLADMHNRNLKVILHMVPWDRDKLPTLHGSIPAQPGEILDSAHIEIYWRQHLGLVQAGVDGFWPDEGDWFNLYERIKRHQLYYQGSLSARPDLRPWSLQRNGYPGIAQWGGWVWSGDTESSWKTLLGQIAVGLNYSVSVSPYWGSDIGGFYSNKELTGELYARWFQFGAFCPSFRSHGVTWHTRLPWGWGSDYMGPKENRNPPLQSEMNDPGIEPIAKKYDELRYRLLPYTYTLAWEARSTGMPLMRPLWLHYPDDPRSLTIGDQYFWGRNLLIAPVVEKGATTRVLYLPPGLWYDWWTNEKLTGGRTITRAVDLSIMPIYARAGAIIPVDPIRQYTEEPMTEPTTIKVFTGADGDFILYDDDGRSQDYLKGRGIWIGIHWNEKERQLTLAPDAPAGAINKEVSRKFNIEWIPGNKKKTILYNGQSVTIPFE